jgi:hypothetical protein
VRTFLSAIAIKRNFWSNLEKAVGRYGLNWYHSGFNVYCGNAICPHNEEGLENLARYIIRASFSQERMTYIAASWTLGNPQ